MINNPESCSLEAGKPMEQSNGTGVRAGDPGPEAQLRMDCEGWALPWWKCLEGEAGATNL